MSTVLGEPLAVFDDVALCDRHDHELRLVTDGQRAYVYPLAGGEVHADMVCSRVGVTITTACTVAMPHDEQCDGHATWRLNTDGRWTSSADARALLATYGCGVEK